jgi:hypothetical protein
MDPAVIDRESAALAIWQACADELPDMDFNEFRRRLEGWEVIPAKVDGRVVGGFIKRGPELHAAVTSGFGRWFTRGMYRKTIGAALEQYGYAMTLPPSSEAGRRFVERLGFKERDGICLLQQQS